MTRFAVSAALSLLLVPLFALQASITFNPEAPGHSTRFPGTEEIVSETRTLLFPDTESIEECLKHTGRISPSVVSKVVVKLQGTIGKPLYPQDVARQLFELAFEDADPLTREERTSNMLFILAALGQSEARYREKLYAYYYGYSAEKFTAARP